MNDTEKLFAIEEIKQLKARYMRFVDTKDWDGFRGLFTQDAHLDYSSDMEGLVAHGPDEAVEQIGEPLKTVTTVHHGHNPEIAITSDTTAEGVWAMDDLLVWDEGSEPPEGSNYHSAKPVRSVHGFGHYFETYQRVGGRWLIKSVKLTRLRVDVQYAE